MAARLTERSGGWSGGWWWHARRRPSANQGARPRGAAIELAIVHSISLPPGIYGGAGIDDLFLNRLDCSAHAYYGQLQHLRVSAHFVIRRTGEVSQYVSCDRRAWHAGVSVWRQRGNCNDWSIGIELEGLESEPFEPAQYRSLARLLRALARRYPLREVVGHEHVAPGRKHDPGPGFDWAGLRLALNRQALWLIGDTDRAGSGHRIAQCTGRRGRSSVDSRPTHYR